MYELYIVLTDTGTLFSRCIGMCTRQPLNHASVAFDSGLREVYSFGRRQPTNAFDGGFVREQAWGSLVRCPERETPCAVYRCRVEPAQYHAIRETVRRMSQRADAYTYNLAGLFALLAGVNWHRSHAFFCSQFVAWLFAEAGVPLTGKPPSLTRPYDLARSDKLEPIYAGDLRRYLRAEGNYSAPKIAAKTAGSTWTVLQEDRTA